jgi:hypothetical protein
MYKFSFIVLVSVLVLLILPGCLTVEKKVYTFEITGKNSGKLTIKFINIMSVKDGDTDVSNEDFDELINTYIESDEIEKDYPKATNIQKRLFEENGQLCAEMILEFPDLETARLYQYNPKSPYMFCVKSAYDSENYIASNGTFGGEIMPVVFWDTKLETLSLTTEITKPDESTVSLVDKYRQWKK